MASDPRFSEGRRPPRSRRLGARATTSSIALAAVAGACTQTQVVLEPIDGGADDTALAPTTITISTGSAHTCAIADGALYCWGKNDYGQLGLGDTIRRDSPERVGTDTDWQAVATGSGDSEGSSSSSLALKADGTLWSFGGNKYGQLGLGSNDLSPHTIPVQVGERSDWRAIALRFQHACALSRDKSLWCWGSNSEGQLGQDDTSAMDHVSAPREVTIRHDFAAVDAGDGHTCAIKIDGTLWCWGRNRHFELGRQAPDQIRRPVPVGNNAGWTVVRSGQNTTCGVRAGVAYCWGESATDMSGVDIGIPGVAPATWISTPIAISGPRVVVDLSFNTFGGALFDRTGGAWVWGRNEEGQLGLGDTMFHQDIVQTAGSDWSQLSVGRFTTCGVHGGTPVCTGANDSGQLGQGNSSNSDRFLTVPLPRQ